MKTPSCLMAALLLGSAASLLPLHAGAQAYPSRPIKLVVGYAAGGGTDIIGRITAQYLSLGLGRPVVVENRPGAASNIATEAVANAAPDGYTLLLASNNITINPYMYKNMNVDVAKALRGVGIIATAPILLVTNMNSPIKNLGELIAYAKQNPGKINYGTPGVGSAQHLAVELLNSMAGLSMVHIPYKGSALSLADLMAGQIQLVSAGISSTRPFIRAGKIRGLAVAEPKRVSTLKELPTVSEVVKDYSVSIWWGIMAPAQAPNEIIVRLSEELKKAVATPEMAEKLAAQGYEIAIDTPEEMDATVRADLIKWGKAVKAAGIVPE